MISADVFTTVTKYTKSPLVRLRAMADCIERVDSDKVEGDIVECGVWLGGNIILSRILSPDRLCWLYDTFEGLPPPGMMDTKKSGAHASQVLASKTHKRNPIASCSDVLRAFKETNTFDQAKLKFVQGMVEDTLQIESNIPEKIAILRLDTDWYSSTKIELEKLWPRVVNKGFLIIDDYGHWMGAKKAVTDYFKDVRAFQKVDYSCVLMQKG